jgi:hypothetical protein
MTACKSVGPNESTNSCVDGVAAGEGDDIAGDFDGIPVALGAAEDGVAGVGDSAKRCAAKIDTIKPAGKNRDITVILRCYP